ncbi:MAG: hypothetical protein PHT41_01050 [Candidatus Omnitrophica bacterium]|nr:hypothetical protein [Candidatus Omnitrophota bacterium]MDD5237920.1 hypothetical protein [Candidatus Omnitrophota bacterium]
MTQNSLIETLQHTVDAENMLHFCCSHIASLINNGRVRKEFSSFSSDAKENKDFLIEKLKNFGIKDSLPLDKCRFCEVKAESFSLLGAINLSLEVINAQIKLYKDLVKSADNKDDRGKFKVILERKNGQRAFLVNEKRFCSKPGDKLSFMDSYCIPEIVSQLWKQ